MREMFIAIGKGVMTAAPWGMMFRVLIGGFMGVMDLFTDAYVCYLYKLEGRLSYFYLTVGIIVGAQLFFTMMVILQYRKLGVKRVLLETAPVLVGLKPALDAKRVASGKEHNEVSIYIFGIFLLLASPQSVIPWVITMLSHSSTTNPLTQPSSPKLFASFVAGCYGRRLH
jgi:hypothetical protein